MSKKENSGRKIRISLRIKLSIAMILTTAVTIIVMASYFITRQSDMLLADSIAIAEREAEHLAVSAREAISATDELTLLSALESSKKLPSFLYSHVLDPSGNVIQSTENSIMGQKLDDQLTRNAISYDYPSKALTQKQVDPSDNGGTIYDFSMPVFDKLTGKKRIATIRLGISDEIIRKEIKKLTKILALITLAFVLAANVVAIVFASLTTRTVKKLSAGVAVIGTGNLDHKIILKSRDEIGLLADQFNIMTSQLKDAQSKEIENRIMQEQLDVAKEIQEGLNPMGFYEKNGLEIKGYTRAAKGVGGDYFDYKEIGDDRIGVLISDVSGKGIPASLVMVMIRTVFIASLHQDSSKIQCSKIVSAINSALSADFAIDKFATLFFMIFDRTREMVSFSNAGHGPLFCYRAALDKCTVTKLDGVPIGVMDDVEYTQSEVHFGIGDIIVLNSDGITEMRNEKREEYGRTRVQRFILENSHLNAKEIVEKLVIDVDNFKGNAPQHDDMTLVIVKRLS